MFAGALDRRSFLQAVLAAGLLLHAPAATAEDLTRREAWRLEVLREAWKRAAWSGRPLLVLVIPSDEAERYRRGVAWGELFNHGSDEVIAALTLVELAAASEADLQRLIPDYAPQTPAPTLVRVAAGALPAAWRGVVAPLPEPPELPRGYWVVPRAEIEALLETIQRELPPGASEDELYDRLAEAVAAEEERRSAPAERAIDERIAALEAAVRDAIRPEPGEIGVVLQFRAGSVEPRRRAPVAGARWGYYGGCGIDYDEADPLRPGEPLVEGILCGQGHVPERSARFLDFLVGEAG